MRRNLRVRFIAATAIVAASILATACDPSNPAHRQAFYDLNPEHGAAVTAETLNAPQRAIVGHLTAERDRLLAALEEHRRQQAEAARPVDCYTAMERVWPPHLWATGRKVINGESGNDPGAQNAVSSAAGCWQMLRMHAHRFDAVGCSWAQRYDAMCNTRAAWHLWQAAGGWSPWSATAY